MSTIKVDQLLAADGTTTTPPTIPALDTRFCTAWVVGNGIGTVSVTDSYNVSSITDNGVGLYTVNFAVAMADANYCVTSSLNYATQDISAMRSHAGPSELSASNFKLSTGQANQSTSFLADEIFMAQVFGGQ